MRLPPSPPPPPPPPPPPTQKKKRDTLRLRQEFAGTFLFSKVCFPTFIQLIGRCSLTSLFTFCLIRIRLYVRSELNGTILPTYDYRMRHAYAMTTTRIASRKTAYHILTTNVNSPKSCRTPVVSLSHAKRSYRVNRP